MLNLNIDQIAQVCHEANAMYCRTIGDYSQPTWNNAPLWQKDSAMNGVLLHIKDLSAGHTPRPEASHERWLKQKVDEGWVWGPIKDPAHKEHPCMRPFDELPIEQQLKDHIFVAIVTAFYNAAKAVEAMKEATSA